MVRKIQLSAHPAWGALPEGNELGGGLDITLAGRRALCWLRAEGVLAEDVVRGVGEPASNEKQNDKIKSDEFPRAGYHLRRERSLQANYGSFRFPFLTGYLSYLRTCS